MALVSALLVAIFAAGRSRSDERAPFPMRTFTYKTVGEAKIQADVATVLQMPDVRERLEGMGADPSGESIAELAARIKTEYDSWGEVVRKANIKAD